MLRTVSLALVMAAWLLVALLIGAVRSEEGMWLPQELPEGVMQDMRASGLELTREEIFNSAGTGIANAVVRVGATGTFVSPDGLILTNHHVAFRAAQRISTPEANYIERGFLAKTRAEEVPAHGYFAYLMQSAQDVTERVLAAVTPSMTPLERQRAIERRTKEIVREAEAGEDRYCEVSDFWGGSRYLLYTYLKIKDVRVVYVPSRAIGEYGGDIDNWMWPRHTGDFSFLRAYVAPDGETAEYSDDNVPYRPECHVKISPDGLAEGDFALIIGFPRKTTRYLTSYGLTEYQEFTYPERMRLYRKMLSVLDLQAASDPVAGVKVAGQIKGINNSLKNNEGMMEGFTRLNLVDRQRRAEQDFQAVLEARSELRQKYGTLLETFAILYDERAKHALKDLILDLLIDKDYLIGQAMLLYKWSIEKTKPDMDRDPDYMDRKIPDLRRNITVSQMSMHLGADREMLRMFVREMLSLPQGQRVGPIDSIFGHASGVELEIAVDGFLDQLYGGTKISLEEERLRMFDTPHEDLVAERDAFIAFAAALYPENEERLNRERAFQGSMSLVMPEWIEAMALASGRTPYPDANGTMRVNYGEVAGYSPRDAVYFGPFTTLAGAVEKHTGEPPFDCPEKIRRLAASKTYGKYVHPDLEDVPVNLLTTNDSTGGNSGSPLLNARGELVGCLFDGNYEAMTSDFKFDTDLDRSIHVDIRYVLFIADHVDGAQNVLKELGLK